jgi:hypothetical protein
VKRLDWLLLTLVGTLSASAPEQPLPFSHKVHSTAAKLGVPGLPSRPGEIRRGNGLAAGQYLHGVSYFDCPGQARHP